MLGPIDYHNPLNCQAAQVEGFQSYLFNRSEGSMQGRTVFQMEFSAEKVSDVFAARVPTFL